MAQSNRLSGLAEILEGWGASVDLTHPTLRAPLQGGELTPSSSHYSLLTSH
jgi:hypothetical protein